MYIIYQWHYVDDGVQLSAHGTFTHALLRSDVMRSSDGQNAKGGPLWECASLMRAV